MNIPRLALLASCAATLAALSPVARAQTETAILTIAQSGIGSNGFGTSWRGQDIELAEDAWLTRIEFQTSGASANVDEIRLMTAVPGPVTLRAVTTIRQLGSAVEAVLGEPYLLRAGTRYTVWFHQGGRPGATSGCDLTRVDPSWGAYHTDVDPTQAPGVGEPAYYWGYQYGTNLRLIGFDNLEISGNLTIGGSASIQLEAQPNDVAFVLFALGVADLPFPPFAGALRLDPATILPASFAGNVGPTGTWVNTLGIPNDPTLRGLTIQVQALHDQTFANQGRFSPLEALRIG
jgi:hypothetical protein